ncbi:MAG: M14 family zinc carboxypeptidase [Candidatus Krumholzibacteriia bacterium]
MPRALIAAAGLALLLAAAPSAAFAAESHSLLLVDIGDPGAAAWLQAHRTELDIPYVKPGSFAHVIAGAADLARLRAAGLAFTVLEADLEAASAYPDKGPGFGIWHTYSESEAWMDSLHLQYPQVVSAKWSIGQSHEGRDIWCFRVSDNPETDEDEPEVLIDGLHHSREIMASEFPVMFAEHLARNYGIDPEITWLVDNRELYVIPIVNPDGFVHNETTNPTGGGQWRKNRRVNGDGTYGVDLNRNYPYMWGYDDSGSSPNPASLTYRGPSAGSEPEVQAMMAFVDGRQIRTHDSVHTYSNLLLYPWGYTATPTADAAAFAHMAQVMTAENGYEPGQPGVILYSVNGGSVDWMYGATGGHDAVLSFSTEIGGGSDGFWPPEERRGPLFQENLWPHLYLMRAAGPFTGVHSPVATDDLGGSLEPGEAGLLRFTIENQSAFSSLTGVTVTLRTDDPWVQFGQAQRTVTSLAPLEGDDLTGDPIPFTVAAGCPGGHLVAFTVTVPLDGGDLTVPLAFRVGAPALLLADDFETGTGRWLGTGTWGWTTAKAHSPTHAITDSPLNYGDNSSTSIATVAAYPAASLAFWHTYAIESGYDFGRVQVSADGGPWTTLGSFTGTQAAWVRQEYDLAAYAGQDLRFRFLLETDYSVTADGWTIDDVEIHGTAPSDGAPPTPAALAPTAGAITGTVPVLTVANVADPQGDPVVYGFRVYADALCTQLIATADDVPAGDGTTAWSPDPLPAGSYWWRAWAGDGSERSLLGEPVPFSVDDLSAVGLPLAGGPRLQVQRPVSGRGAELRLLLPTAAQVTVDVHDLRGALVRRLHTGRLDSGERTLVWDGRDRGGRAAASGVYLVRLKAGRDVATGRVVLVR